MVVRFLDIGGSVEHHVLSFLFILHIYIILAFQSFYFERHLMKMIPETRCVAKFDIYIFIGISIHILNIKSGNKVVIRKMCGFDCSLFGRFRKLVLQPKTYYSF